ncbi:MAG: sulfite exporter TauE/SafE family protein [Candidatus Sericytochromatia bacterium]
MEYFLLFTAGLLSSMHCLGMCGCFVTAYSVNLKGNNFQKALSHLSYSFGRITTYTFIGAVMGFLGSNLYFLAKMAGIQNYITVGMSLLMIYLGLSLSGLVPKILFFDKLGEQFLKYAQKPFSKLVKNKGLFSTYNLGLVLGFLPCCLLYTIELQAMNTGSVLKGALSMLFFGLGTIPALFSFGMAVNFINQGIKNKLTKFSSYIIIIMGLLSIYRVLYT